MTSKGRIVPDADEELMIRTSDVFRRLFRETGSTYKVHRFTEGDSVFEANLAGLLMARSFVSQYNVAIVLIKSAECM
jgi:hypothetical protein